MCGIAGVIDFSRSISREKLREQAMAMAASLAHRGPDSSGCWDDSSAGVAIGHQRLAVVDLSQLGHQPMVSPSGRYIISYNGEIYGFKHLRKRLEVLGAFFQGNSDTEVILGAIEVLGIEKAIDEFVGMFSFALWDRKKHELHLVRDRLGIKPLYYGRFNNIFLFGSELRALGVNPACTRIPDINSIALYMRYSCVPAPWSIWEDTKKLEPGKHLIIDSKGNEKLRTYWSVYECAQKGKESFFTGDLSEAVDHTHTLLNEAVSSRLVADVPIGLLLSGGIDSSTIAAVSQENSSNPLKTFTIGLENPTYDESHSAASIASYLGTDHNDLVITAEDALSVVPDMINIYDEPFADSSQIPSYLVCKLARQDVTVCLTGDGGDEVFAGYNRHRWSGRISALQSLVPQQIRNELSRRLLAMPDSVSSTSFAIFDKLLPESMSVRDPAEKVRKLAAAIGTSNTTELYKNLAEQLDASILLDDIAPPNVIADEPKNWPELPDLAHQLLYLDTVSYLPNDILTKLDRASMAVSLEARIPILDHRIVEFSWTLPPSLRTKTSKSKLLLREVLRKFVPDELFERPKWGFAIPVGQWLRGPLREWAESHLSETSLRSQGLFNVNEVRKMWDMHLSKKQNLESKIWTVLMLTAWLNNA